MLVTLLETFILAKLLQALNASYPMFVTPSSITTFLISLLYRNGESPIPDLNISPLPLIVNSPLLSKVYVTLSPHLPLSTMVADVDCAVTVFSVVAP